MSVPLNPFAAVDHFTVAVGDTIIMPWDAQWQDYIVGQRVIHTFSGIGLYGQRVFANGIDAVQSKPGTIIAIGIELHADDDDDDVNRRNVELELILSQLVSGQISHNPKGPQQVH